MPFKTFDASRHVDLLDLSQATDLLGKAYADNSFQFLNLLVAQDLRAIQRVTAGKEVYDKDGNVRDNPAARIRFDDSHSNSGFKNIQQLLEYVLAHSNTVIHTVDTSASLQSLGSPSSNLQDKLNSVYASSIKPKDGDLIFVGVDMSTGNNAQSGVWHHFNGQWEHLIPLDQYLNILIRKNHQRIMQLEKAVTVTLTYDVNSILRGITGTLPTNIRELDLNALDAFGKNCTLSTAAPYEGIEVYYNGVRIIPEYRTVTGTEGDYRVDYPNNKITFKRPIPLSGGSILQVDILLPPERVNPAYVRIHQLDLDTAKFNGTRTKYGIYSLLTNQVEKPDSVERDQELMVYANGERLKPGKDYKVLDGGEIEFTQAPVAGDHIWALWYESRPQPVLLGGGGGVSDPTDKTILQHYGYDPKDGTKWIDARGGLKVIVHFNDLTNRNLLPVNHLVKGSLVVVKETGQIFELIEDPGKLTNTIADWKEVGAGGVKYVNRLADLPNAKSTPKPQDGVIYVTEVDFTGQPYHRMVTWDKSIKGAPAKSLLQAVPAAAVTPPTVPAAGLAVGWAGTGAEPVMTPGERGLWIDITNAVGYTGAFPLTLANPVNIPINLSDGNTAQLQIPAGNYPDAATTDSGSAAGPNSLGYQLFYSGLPAGLTGTMPAEDNGSLYLRLDIPGPAPVYPVANRVGVSGSAIADSAAYTKIVGNPHLPSGTWYVIDDPNGITPLAGEPYAGVHLPLGTKLLDCGDPQKGKGGWAVSPPDANYVVGNTPTTPAPQYIDDLTQPTLDGGWRFINRETYVNPLVNTADHPLDNQKGDFQTVTENGAKVIKVYDGTGWVTLFDEVQIKGWIASLALFRGTASEDPTQHPGTITWTDLPDLPALSATQDKGQTGRYWIWAGQDPFTVSRGTAGTAPGHAQARQGVAIDLAHGITDDASLVQVLNTDPKPNQWAGRTVSAGFTPAAGNPFAGIALAAGDGIFWTGATGFSINDTTNNVVYDNGWALIKNYTAGSRLVMDSATRTALNTALGALPITPAVNATPKIGADLNGATLHVGDWLVIADRGTGVAGDSNEVDLHWVRVGGDLLTKSRGTNLFGLKNWVAGSWEKDSLVVQAGNIYRARTAVVPADIAPNAAAIALPAGAVMPVAGIQLTNDLPPPDPLHPDTVVINDQTDFERLCITDPPPPQWMAYPIQTDFTATGTPNGFFDGESFLTGERMVWTGFANLTVDDPANTIKVVNGWLYDPGTVTAVGGGQGSMISATVLAAIQALIPTTKWDKVPIAGGMKFLPDETGIPVTGVIGDSYLILASATYANGNPAIITWDQGAGQWVPVGGGSGGTPMNLMAAEPLLGVGCPIGTIIMWASATIPAGWLPLTGQAIDATAYPELAALFPGGHLPDMAGQFIRIGAIETGFKKHPYTTARPRHAFITSADGQHEHSKGFQQDHNNWRSGGGGGPHLGYATTTSRAGEHHHTISGGGDPETAPDFVYLGMLIKAAEKTAHIRTP